jgi:hypothetical protein
MKTIGKVIGNWLVGVLLGMLVLPFETQAFYNPTTGRWLSRDPAAEGGGVNNYAFALNDPVDDIDSDGLRPLRPPSPYPYPWPPTIPIPTPPSPFPRPSGPLPTPGPIGGPYNYNVRPWWPNPEVTTMYRSTGRQAQDACRRLALAKPGQNQYFYSHTSIGRATGAAAVLWGSQAGQAAAVIPPGYKAALAYRAGSVHRGHLIPNRYGGSGGLENIVTQDATFNLSTIKTSFEHKIDAELSTPNVCKFVCVLNVPAYRGRGAMGVMDPGRPVPIGFAVAIITGSSYFSDFVIQPVIIGDLANDIAPWNTWATGDIPLN